MNRKQRRTADAQQRTKPPIEAYMQIVEENGEPVLYLIENGKRIAKRFSGQSWINLEPGYTVRGGEPGSYGTVTVEYDDDDARPQKRFDISFGKVRYEPGAPKNLPRWVWACDCVKCAALEDSERIHGPFKTLREAERDAEATVVLLAADCGTPH
jgi:hypothetical protein